MARSILVVQEKGGVGKSLVARALAEAAPDAPIIEVDASSRLLELEERVRFFPMRADRAEIERSGGKAARSEFDQVVQAIMRAEAPTIADIGANTSASLLTVLAELASDDLLNDAEIAVLLVVTADPGALAEGPRLLALSRPWARRLFVIENRLHGPIGEEDFKLLGKDIVPTSLEFCEMEEVAQQIVLGGGLAVVPRLDLGRLSRDYGVAQGARIRRDAIRLRTQALEAVAPAARWLVEEEDA